MQTSRRSAALAVVFATATFLVPTALSAQSASAGAIAGVVRDTTGAVLPGVTVEASSPALIEKVRSAVSDARGNYKIVDLRPGLYSVTFTLAGFSTFKREGIELTTGFTATANADLTLGELQETITVSGASPVVDVQNVRTQTVFSHEMLDAVPTSKTLASFAALTLGASTSTLANQDVGGNKGEQPVGIAMHGGHAGDSKMRIDGFYFQNWSSTGGGPVRVFQANAVAMQETTLESSGMSAEAETGGIQINYVPRDGGNSFSVYTADAFSSGDLQNRNLTDEHVARGLRTAPSVRRIYDFGAGLGGPIMKDRVWFYTVHRWWGASEYQPGAYFNAALGTFIGAASSGVTRYVPDTSRPAYFDGYNQDHSTRLSWQAAPKHRLGVYNSVQRDCYCFNGVGASSAPEATSLIHLKGVLTQGMWTFPATNRLLVEGGVSYGYFPKITPRGEGVTPQHIAIGDTLLGISYGAQASVVGTPYSVKPNMSNRFDQRFSVSYVTGSHAFKTGITRAQGWDTRNTYVNQNISYTFRNGVPIALTQYALPYFVVTDLNLVGAFAQDQWKVKRVTVNAGVRFDYFDATVRASDLPASRFVPARHFDEVTNAPSWKDIAPRLGVAYDLFGNGRTAFKVAVGRYVESMGLNFTYELNPFNASEASATRTWTDVNGNFIPDCDFTIIGQNAECGALSNTRFGTSNITTRFADDVRNGWNVRSYSWLTSASLQQEFRPGTALNVGYFRTSWGNQTVIQNQAVTPADFRSYCVTAPTDTRLPNNGGYQVCGLYNVDPSKFGQVNNLVQHSSDFGGQSEVYNGVDVTVNSRFGRGGLLAGGVNVGKTVTDNCFQNSRPDLTAQGFAAASPRNSDFCRISSPLRAGTQVKFNAVYPMPFGLQTAVTFQNLPGVNTAATNVFTNAQIAPVLDRNLAAGAAGTATIALLTPQTKFEDRLTQLDLRFSKLLRIQRLKVQGNFDIYNVLNAGTILAVNSSYGPNWLRPLSIIGARLFKVGAVVDF